MNSADVMMMQQDAIRRAKEMQKRCIEKSLRNEPKHEVCAPLPVVKAKVFEKKKSSPVNILKNFNLDEEKILIIILLIILVNEQADIILIMALVYLLLP